MDVSKFQLEGEWLELEVESKNVDGPLRFKIKPLSSDEQIDLAEAGEGNIKDFLKQVNELVLDWDLEDGKEKLICDDENKEKYLPYLIGMKIKPEEDETPVEHSIYRRRIEDFLEKHKKKEKDIIIKELELLIVEFEDEEKLKVIKSVGIVIITFAQDFGNFVKN